MKGLLLVAALSLLLTACSDNSEEKQSTQAAEKPYNPLETQMKALDKAESLEGQMLQDAKDRDQRMREQGG